MEARGIEWIGMKMRETEDTTLLFNEKIDPPSLSYFLPLSPSSLSLSVFLVSLSTLFHP